MVAVVTVSKIMAVHAVVKSVGGITRIIVHTVKGQFRTAHVQSLVVHALRTKMRIAFIVKKDLNVLNATFLSNHANNALNSSDVVNIVRPTMAAHVLVIHARSTIRMIVNTARKNMAAHVPLHVSNACKIMIVTFVKRTRNAPTAR